MFGRAGLIVTGIAGLLCAFRGIYEANVRGINEGIGTLTGLSLIAAAAAFGFLLVVNDGNRGNPGQ